MNNELLAVLRLYLQENFNLQEKKKKLSDKEIAALKPPKKKITQADILAMRGVELDENEDLDEKSSAMIRCPHCGTMNERSRNFCKNCSGSLASVKETLENMIESFIKLEEKKKRKKRKKTKTDFDVGGQPQYRARRSKKQIDRQASLTRQYNNAETEAARQKIRDKIDKSREEEGVDESLVLSRYQLSELINEVVEAEKLSFLLEKIEELEEKKSKKRKKKKKSGKSSKGLSAAVKKSLDKKADRRGLTRGSVYAEFRKGLAAYYSSGSRKGMSAHQWAHARVNSANPSKSWAVVKKRKGGKKKKK